VSLETECCNPEAVVAPPFSKMVVVVVIVKRSSESPSESFERGSIVDSERLVNRYEGPAACDVVRVKKHHARGQVRMHAAGPLV